MRTEDQNSTLAFPIFADDSTAIGTGKTGLTITATLAKNGGTANAVTPSYSELGNGIYWVTPIAAHRDTIGCNVWQFSASGAVIAPVFERIRLAPATIVRVDTAETNVLATLPTSGRALADSAYTAPANSTIASIYALVQLIDADVATMPTDVRDAILNRVLAGNHDIENSLGRLAQFLSSVLLAQNSNQRTVQVTGSNHVAADAHEIQTAVLAKFANTDTGETTAANGSVAKLSQGTSGGDATLAKQNEILDAIDAYISSVTAAVSGTQDTIVGFPASLTIGDSYTEDGGNAIHVFIRDENDDPITSVGSKNFTDTDFAPELIITHIGNTGRVRATVTYVDPGAAESYLRVELPSSETRRASPGSATMQCVLKWDGVQKTLATQAVSWVARL